MSRVNPRDAQVAIVDREARRPSPARIHLNAQGSDRRVPGDLYITREKLLAMPEEYLSACMEIVAARDTTEILKDSLEFATQVQDLMSISNFEKLSERITSRSLEILGLPWGTLLIHDPQVERFVVSFSNDPDHRETEEFVPGIPSELLRRSLDPENFYALQAAAMDHGGMLAIPFRSTKNDRILNFQSHGERPSMSRWRSAPRICSGRDTGPREHLSAHQE